MSVRLEMTGLMTHATGLGSFTACGILFGLETEADTEVCRIPWAEFTDEPVDCMSCLVQETRGPTDRITLHATLTLPIPIIEMTFVLEPDK